MQMIHDDICVQIQDVINSACAPNSSFSVIATVIENRKLEIFKQNTREEKERLEIHVADQTCQLFKFTLWGQSAVLASAKFRPGAIILIDQFVTKRRHASVVEGVCCENTTAHLLYNRHGITFEQQRFPILYKSLVELIKFSHDRYKLFYTCLDSDTIDHRSALSQLLSRSQQTEGQTGSSEGDPTPSTMPSVVHSLSAEEDAVFPPSSSINNMRHAQSTAVQTKVLEDFRRVKQQQTISLRVSKDVKIRLCDAVCPVDQASGCTRAPVLCLAAVSKRWKVRDARTDEFIFLCFESKKEAYARAAALFRPGDGDSATGPSALLVHASHLLILREGGRSLKACHNKLVLGHHSTSASAGFVPELLVSEESALQLLSAKRRRVHSAEASVKEGGECGRGDVKRKKLQSGQVLADCCLTGMSFDFSSSGYMSFAPTPTCPSTVCHNVACDAFLWQLLVLGGRRGGCREDSPVSSTATNADGGGTPVLLLQFPTARYSSAFFHFKTSTGPMKLAVDNVAMSRLLGDIPAPLLAEALLHPRLGSGPCCAGCAPLLERVHRLIRKSAHTDGTGIVCVGGGGECMYDEGPALRSIKMSVRRVLLALSCSSSVAVGPASRRSLPRSCACKTALAGVDDKHVFVCGSGEAFTVQVSVPPTSTTLPIVDHVEDDWNKAALVGGMSLVCFE